MMKKYEFHSALPPTQVFARLSAQVKEERYLDPWVGREIFLYTRKGDRFWLSYTGKHPARGFVPFCGRVDAEGDGCLITGSFSPRVPIAVIAVLFSFGTLLIGMPPEVTVVCAVVVFVYVSCCGALMQRAFFGARREAILNFIQENLLK